jgi:hypothetical protein
MTYPIASIIWRLLAQSILHSVHIIEPTGLKLLYTSIMSVHDLPVYIQPRYSIIDCDQYSVDNRKKK